MKSPPDPILAFVPGELVVLLFSGIALGRPEDARQAESGRLFCAQCSHGTHRVLTRGRAQPSRFRVWGPRRIGALAGPLGGVIIPLPLT